MNRTDWIMLITVILCWCVYFYYLGITDVPCVRGMYPESYEFIFLLPAITTIVVGIYFLFKAEKEAKKQVAKE